MAWWALAGSLGLNFISAESQKMADKHAFKAQTLVREYNNTMVRLSDAQNQNAITTNQLLASQAFADEAIQIKRGSLITQAKTEVSAAAAGVKGRSVNQAMFAVMRNASEREYQRQVNMASANLAFDQQRRGSAMGAQMQQDFSYIPKPRSASYYLGAASNVLNTTMALYGPGTGGSNGSQGSSGGFMSQVSYGYDWLTKGKQTADFNRLISGLTR